MYCNLQADLISLCIQPCDHTVSSNLLPVFRNIAIAIAKLTWTESLAHRVYRKLRLYKWEVERYHLVRIHEIEEKKPKKSSKINMNFGSAKISSPIYNDVNLMIMTVINYCAA